MTIMNTRPNPLGLQVGDKLKDQDKRSGGNRVVTITRLSSPGGKWYAEYFSGYRHCKIAFDAIHTDDNCYTQGYRLIAAE